MSAGSGLFTSARRLFATVLEIVQVRLELVATELELEKLRLFEAMLLAAAALFGLGIGVMLLCALLVLLVGEGYRLHALAALAALFIGGSLWGLRAARAKLRGPGTLFDASVTELARDRAELMPRD
jgi:uncharacterized membrane protein YqjE